MTKLVPDGQSPMKTIRVGVDVGGTFTDLVFSADDGQIVTHKVPSTPDDYSGGILAGLEEAFKGTAARGFRREQLTEMIHGTTVATNAVMQNHGACTALITTSGFRDVLEIRRLRMPELYNLQWDKPLPLVPRYLRLEVDERVDFAGNILCPLDEDRVHEHAELMKHHGVESIAVCLINSYANPMHEMRIKEILVSMLPDVPVSLSTEIIREMGEFERTSTAVTNAYVRPKVEQYLNALERRLDEAGTGLHGQFLVMQSNGSGMTLDAAKQRPCYLIESGPAAGVIGSHAVARQMGSRNVITLDMGGTTAKAAMIEDDEISFIDEYEIGGGLSVGSRLMKGNGYLLRIPAIDLAEIGAGGGSIAWVDSGGALQVGPKSVGADPGPACYNKGNVEATITDANIVLGYINPETFAGGSFRLDTDRSWDALKRLGQDIGMAPEEAALAVHLVGNARMGRAIRAVSTERGRDVREFTLMAFGGNGPIHAAQLAKSLSMTQVVIPQHPGVFSALGLICAPIGHQFVQTYKAHLATMDEAHFVDAVESLKASASDELCELGYPLDRLMFTVEADIRYIGQYFRVRIALPTYDSGESIRIGDTLTHRFEAEHERRYGHRSEGDPVEVVSLHLTARVDTGRSPEWIANFPDPHGVGAFEQPAVHDRRVYISRDAGWQTTPIVSRSQLHEPMTGPLLIEELDTTIVVPSGCATSLDDHGNVIIGLDA